MAGHFKDPLVSVIIVNRNGAGFIEPCLKSVLDCSYQALEVIFVDNASTDGSLDELKEKFGREPRIKIIANKEGLGPAKGRNIGIRNSSGKYIAFLDNDTVVDPDWLKEPVRLFGSEGRIGAAQSKILLFDRKTIDSLGHFISMIGFPYEIGVGETDRGQYDRQTEIFGARSAAMFIRRDVLDRIGYFDPDYFMHSEETDLSWRVWLQGYRIVFVPGSVVFHKRSGSISASAKRMMLYEGSKNCTKTLIKNLGPARLTATLPLHILAWLAMSFLLLLKGRAGDSKAIIKGLAWVLRNIRRILKERKIIQQGRVNTDSRIASVMTGNLKAADLLRKGLKWTGGV
jgi:hypothetical protein